MTKILLVEDDKSLREIYGVRLLAEGYDIVSAGDGEEALAIAIKERPDLVLSDVMMPKISGFDMLDILRSTPETRDIKVIMMTALSSEDQRQRGEQLGADRYLVKSQVGIEDVVRTVHDVLGDMPGGSAAAQPQTATPVQTSSATPDGFTPPNPVQPTANPAASTPAQDNSSPAAPANFSQNPTPSQASDSPAPNPAANPAASQPSDGQTVTPMQPASALPQPTAPFSTSRPANLGDRIIAPISQPSQQPDFSALMDQALDQTAAPAPDSSPISDTSSEATANVSPIGGGAVDYTPPIATEPEQPTS